MTKKRVLELLERLFGFLVAGLISLRLIVFVIILLDTKLGSS